MRRELEAVAAEPEASTAVMRTDLPSSAEGRRRAGNFVGDPAVDPLPRALRALASRVLELSAAGRGSLR